MTKKMTRTALITLAAVLVLAAVCVALVCTGTASAKELTKGDNEQSITVTYTVAGAWTVTITDGPIALQPDRDSDIQITVSKAVLGDGENLSITVESENGYKLKHGSDELTYTLKNGGTTFDNSSNKTVLENINGESNLESDGKVTLKAQITQDEANKAKYEGAYTDTLNFTVRAA